MQQHPPPSALGGMSSPQFIHQGYLHKRNLLGWRKHYCILRGRNMELYRVKSATDDTPKSMTPHRVLLIQHFHVDYRVADQFDVVLPLGGKRTFKLDPDQIKRGEKAQWVQALQTALLCDNALERYGEDITKQLMTYASKQVSECGSLRLDDSMWKTLRKRSIHGDLWSRFIELVTKGTEVTEVTAPPAVGLRYLLLMDMDPAVPRQVRLVPIVPAEDDDDAGNYVLDGAVAVDEVDAGVTMRRIDLQHIVSVADCGTGNAADAAVRLRRFTLTHMVEDETVTETFEAATADLRSRLVFGLAHILKNVNAAKQHSPRQMRLRRLSPASSTELTPSTMTTRQERASLSQVSTTSSLDVLGVNSQHVDAAIRSFNVKPKSGIATAVDLGVIDDESPAATAEFLRHTKGLDKDKIGEYLGGDDAFSISVLSAYAMSFAWEGKAFEVCLRDFLSKFRLPGESQKIDRTMEAFAKAFHVKNPHMFQHHDAAHILAFSTIMLNTDLHNKSMNNRHRMTKAQFVRNNRGIDKDKTDIPPAILEAIFDSIKKQPVETVRDRDDNGNLFAHPDMTGWLKTYRVSGIKTRRRWFILTNHCLYFFEREEDIDPLGFYALENVKVEGIAGTPVGFELRATAPNASVKSVLYPKQRARRAKGGLTMRALQCVGFAADTPEDAKSWMTTLEKFIVVHETNASQIASRASAIPSPMLRSHSHRPRGSTSTSVEDADDGDESM